METIEFSRSKEKFLILLSIFLSRARLVNAWFILPDWSPPDNPIQSERASSSLMECEKFILPDWSPPNDPARVLAAETLVMIKMVIIILRMVAQSANPWPCLAPIITVASEQKIAEIINQYNIISIRVILNL